jgi:FHA domain
MYGVDFNDRLLTIASDGVPLAQSALRLLGRPVSSAGALAAMVDVLRERLPSALEPRLWAAVPSRFNPNDLGEMLRMLRAAGYGVQGFIDSAAATVAWTGLSGQTIVVDFGLHGRALSVVVNEAGSAQLRRTVQLPGGQADLHGHWLNLAAESLIRQTRFDPLHDPVHENLLRSRLPSMAVEAQREGSAQCTVDAEQRQFELVLSNDQFVTASQAWLAPLTQLLQTLCAGVGDCNVIIPEGLLGTPGLEAALTAAHMPRLFAVAEGTSACAVSLTAEGQGGTDARVPYLTHIEVPGHAASDNIRPLALQSGNALTLATHLVYQGRALLIPESGLVLGRSPGTENALRLPEGIAGLSRRHCTLQRSPLGALVIDHSQHGTFVDGLRVSGRRLLPAGCVLRLGTPGIEIPLVTLDHQN